MGAHVGYHSLALASQGARVVSFEPGASNISRFREHLDRNRELASKIVLETVALSNENGEMNFVESSDMQGASSGSHLATATPPLDSAVYVDFESKLVKSATVDSLLQGRLPPPDVIKIDVEGAEHLVLEGARTTLLNKKPLLLIEVHHICVMLGLAQLLQQANYRVTLLDEHNSTPSRCFISAEAT
ncbi:MAG TPA: FkbM family methyltransferase [Polyangiaceae bacterium]